MRRGAEGLVGLQTEIDGIGVAVVPSAPHPGIARHLVRAHHLGLRPHKLLLFAQVGHRILAQIVSGIDEQGSCRRVVNPVVSTALRGGDLGTDAILECGGVIAQSDVLADASLGILGVIPCRSVAGKRLYEDVAIFLSAAGAADMRLREPRHHLGHRSPPRIGLHRTVGARLHHAKGHAWPGEGTPHPHASDARIHILPVLGLRLHRKKPEEQYDIVFYIHSLVIIYVQR